MDYFLIILGIAFVIAGSYSLWVSLKKKPDNDLLKIPEKQKVK